jgi:hypothetical protein
MHTQKNTGKQTVEIIIPARVSRILKRQGITPKRFVRDVWSAVASTEDLAETVASLYPLEGKPGYVCGLFIVTGG